MKIQQTIKKPLAIASSGVRISSQAGTPGIPSGGSGYTGLTDLGAGLVALSNEMKQVDEKFAQAERSSQLAGLRVQLVKDVEDLRYDYKGRTDYKEFGDITKKLSRLKVKYQDQIDDIEVSDLFLPEFDMKAVLLSRDVRDLKKEKFVDADQVNLGNELDTLINTAGQNGNYENILNDMFSTADKIIAARQASGVLNAKGADNARDSFRIRAWDNYLAQQVKHNPIETQEALKNFKMFPGMPQEQRLEWQDKANGAGTTKSAQQATDKIMAGISDPKEQITAARKIRSEIRDNVVSRVRTRQEDNRRLEIREQGKQADTVTDLILKGVKEGLTKEALLELAHSTEEPTAKAQNLNLVENMFGRGKTSDYLKFVEGQVFIDTKLQNKEDVTFEVLNREYSPHMGTKYFNELVDYYNNKGNIGSLKRTDAEAWFKVFTGKASKERPKAYVEYFSYLVSRLEPGKKPQANDIKAWSQDFMQTEGIEGGWWDTEMTRGEAIKSGSGSFGKFIPDVDPAGIE